MFLTSTPHGYFNLKLELPFKFSILLNGNTRKLIFIVADSLCTEL